MIIEEKLDDTWIQDFDKVDKPYKDFYKENVYYVHINIFYVNNDNEIEKITNEIFFMKSHNVISREEVIDIIKRNSLYNKNMYSLLSILKYNFTLNPDEITDFLNTKNDIYYCYDENFTVIKHIDTIVFEKTISMFQDLNTLIIIYYEKDKNNNIKKENINSCTKKIYFKKSSKSNKYNTTIRNL